MFTCAGAFSSSALFAVFLSAINLLYIRQLGLCCTLYLPFEDMPTALHISIPKLTDHTKISILFWKSTIELLVIFYTKLHSSHENIQAMAKQFVHSERPTIIE